MICSKCGKEIPEGKLYCSFCGEEVYMVPDFEPEIENEIEESLSSLIQDFTENDRKENKKRIPDEDLKYSNRDEDLDIKDYEEDLDSEDFNFSENDLPNEDFWDVEEVEKLNTSYISKLFKNKIAGFVLIAVASVFVISCIIIGINITVSTTHKNSFDYQVKMATKAYEEGDFKTAVNYMEKAVSLHPTDQSVKFQLADYYVASGLQDNAILVLKEMILSKDETNRELAYTKLFDLLAGEGKSEEINEILSECEDEELLLKFQQYTALKPELEPQEGKYTENIYIKITANTNGTIYYTLDGTTPNTDSAVYTSPIYLENGYYSLNAIFVNDYGQISEIASARYDVNSTVPKTPVVNLESGSFTRPEYITVETAQNYEYVIYYTTDGSEPGMDSNMYAGPICMPLGKSTFSFVAVSTTDEVKSEVVSFTYELNLPSTIVTAPAAAQAVVDYRYSLGDLVDKEGHLSTISGRLVYMCDSAIYMNDNTFFIVTEYFENADNFIRNKTGLQYIVATNAPVVLGTLERDENGEFYVKSV